MSKDRDKLEFKLTQYLDGELSRREAVALEGQLEADESLREELGHYAALQGQLAAMATEQLGDVDYDAQRSDIMSALERKALLGERSRRPLVLRPWFAPVAAVAAAAVIMVSFWMIRSVGPARDSLVAVAILPATSPIAGAAMVSVEYPAAEGPTPLALPEDFRTPSALPPGTVMVSAGTVAADADDPTVDFPMWLE